MPRLVLILMLMISGLLAEALPAQTYYTPEETSRLWIEGSSNINRFECEAKSYRGFAHLFTPIAEESINSRIDEQLDIRIEIDVDGFECGRSRMNRDLRDALKANEFPEISFVYTEAVPADTAYQPVQKQEILLDVTGTLTVAGVSRHIRFQTLAKYLDENRVQVEGKKKIRMTDYNITPPTGLLGLVQANEELTVHFNLIASPEENPDEE
jgi:hypothetical protein